MKEKITYSPSIKTCLISMYILTIINFILSISIYIYNNKFNYIESFNYREFYYNKIILVIQLLLLFRCLTIIYEKYIKDIGINSFFFLMLISYVPLILSLFYANNIIFYIIGSIIFILSHLYIFKRVSTIKYFIFILLATFISLILSYYMFVLLIKSFRNIILIFVSCAFMYYLFKGIFEDNEDDIIKNNNDKVLKFDDNAIFVRDYSYNHNEEMIYKVTSFGRNAICFAKDFDNGNLTIMQGENIVKSIPKEIKK